MIIKSNNAYNSVVLKFVIYTFVVVNIALFNIACSTKQEADRYIYDVHGVIIKKMDKKHAVYVTKDGNSLSVSLDDIKYKYSNDRLINDIYSNIEINHECNIKQVFFILFDQDLNIIEVRAADMFNPGYRRCPDISQYIASIRSTQGNWIQKEPNAKGQLHLFVFSMLVY